MRKESRVLAATVLIFASLVASAQTIQEYPAVFVDNKDIVWLSDFGGNSLLRFDPKAEKFTVLKSNSRNARVRQILGRPGELWLPESGADKLVVVRE